MYETVCARLRFNYARVCPVTKGRRALVNIGGGGQMAVFASIFGTCGVMAPHILGGAAAAGVRFSVARVRGVPGFWWRARKYRRLCIRHCLRRERSNKLNARKFDYLMMSVVRTARSAYATAKRKDLVP